MSEKKSNNANTYAKECIVQALLVLIYEKPLSSISITELTERAGVSRMTFYRNYDSKESVLITELAEIMSQYRSDDRIMGDNLDGNCFSYERMLHCFQYFYDHHEFVNGLIYCGMDQLFLTRLTDLILNKWSPKFSGKENYYKLCAFTGAIFNTYISWAADDFSEPVENIARYMEKTFINF